MSASDELSRDPQESPSGNDSEANTVLELFGVELKVRNHRLAEILKMDAREALNAELHPSDDADAVRERAAETAEAVPDVVMQPITPRFENELRHRAELRERASTLGTVLGFEVEPNGDWNSPTGIQILSRVVDDNLTPAAATDTVSKVGERIVADSGVATTVLFIASDSDSAGSLASAIRERNIFDHVRVITLKDLEFIRSLFTAQVLDHHGVLVLLTPVADADVGDLLGIIRSAAG